MLSLWIIQAALNLFLQRNISRHGIQGETVMASIQSLQLITAVFFTSAFVLRFALPSFSSEKRMAWILGTSPISPRRIFFAKLFYYEIIFIIIGLGLGIVNSVLLGISLLISSIFLFMLAIMIASITIFGLAIGTLFPNTESDNAEAISTSLPGLTFTFASLFYGGLGSFLFYNLLTNKATSLIGIYIAISICFSLGMLAIVFNKLRTFNPFAEESF